MKEKMGMDRPPIGYFSRVRLHHSERPKPELKPQDLPDPLPEPGDTSKRPDPKSKIIPNYFPAMN